MRAAGRLLLVAAAAGAVLAYAASARAGVVSAGRVAAEVDEPGTLLDELIAEGAAIFSGGNMRLSSAGLELLKRLEGFAPTWYADASGHSIGYGHFGLDDLVFPGEAIPSLPENLAAQLLEQDVREAERVVSSAVRVPLTQGQFDSLVSFAYNVGSGAFRSSTLARLLNAGDAIGAAGEFKKWRFYRDAQGVKREHSGLVQRRAREAALFAMNDYGSTTA